MQHPPHLSPEEIATGIRTKRLLKGTIRCKRDDWTECYVVVHSEDKLAPRRAVNISGRMRVNRALDGDVVAVELTETERDCNDDIAPAGGGEGNEVKAAEETAEPSIAAIEGLAEEPTSATKEKTLHGKVVGIVRRNWRQYAGILEEVQSDDIEATTFATFYPVILESINDANKSQFRWTRKFQSLEFPLEGWRS